jgi:hypothetical protein
MGNLYKNRKVLSRAIIMVLLTMCFFVSPSSSSYGQAADNQEWQFLKESEGVKIYYLISTCSAQNYLHLKLHNTSTLEKRLIWAAAVKEGDHFKTIPTMPTHVLKAGEENASECGSIKEFLAIPVINEFNVSDLTFSLIILP